MSLNKFVATLIGLATLPVGIFLFAQTGPQPQQLPALTNKPSAGLVFQATSAATAAWSAGGGGGGGNAVSNSVPSPLLYARDGTNVNANLNTYNFFPVFLTNNTILNLTWTPGSLADGESRTFRFHQIPANSTWLLYSTNGSIHLGLAFTGYMLITNTWVNFRYNAISNWFEPIGQAPGY